MRRPRIFMRNPFYVIVAIAGALLVGHVSACGTATGVDGREVATVDVTPPTTSVGVGGTVPLVATVRDDAGIVIAGRAVFWSSSDTDVATVSPLGVVSGRVAGNVEIAANAGGRFAIASVSVVPRAVASVVVLPSDVELIVGATAQLQAATYDATGGLLSSRLLLWSTSNPAVAQVDGSGLVSGMQAGTATITATSEGKSATTQVVVRAAPVANVSVSPTSPVIFAGHSLQLSATLTDPGGNVLAGRPIAWTSSNTGVATVSGTGVVFGVAPGTAVITATSEGQSGSTTVTVSLPPVATVSISPASSTVNVGSTRQLAATLRDANGTVLTGRQIVWSSSDDAIAIVSQTGLVTGKLGGSVTITATSEGKSGTAAVQVNVVVSRVSVFPSSADIDENGTVQLIAIVHDVNGNVLVGYPVTWSSDNSQIATVTATGLVRGVRQGQTRVRATVGGKSDSSQIDVDD